MIANTPIEGEEVEVIPVYKKVKCEVCGFRWYSYNPKRLKENAPTHSHCNQVMIPDIPPESEDLKEKVYL